MFFFKLFALVGPDPVLLIANQIDILRYNLVTGQFQPLVYNQRYVTALDFHWLKDYVFWTDTSSGALYRSNLAGQDIVSIHTELGNPTSIAVDWIHDNLYWADAVQGRIESSDLDGRNTVVLLRGDGFKPGSLAVDPCNE